MNHLHLSKCIDNTSVCVIYVYSIFQCNVKTKLLLVILDKYAISQTYAIINLQPEDTGRKTKLQQADKTKNKDLIYRVLINGTFDNSINLMLCLVMLSPCV